jgi:predicted secreted hydrolase
LELVVAVAIAAGAAGTAARGGIGVKSRRLVQLSIVLARLLACLALLSVAARGAAAFQATPMVSDAPVPVQFPRDDGPHDSNIEWWYFTGHLFTEDGDRYGFEYVTFRARDGNLEGYVSHFAVTDNPHGKFMFDQRIRGAAGVTGDVASLDIDLNGWTMQGGDGQFDLTAAMPGYAVRLEAATAKPVVLHDGDGYIDYGNGTASYYYSWTRLDVSGTLDLGQGPQPVSG